MVGVRPRARSTLPFRPVQLANRIGRYGRKTAYTVGGEISRIGQRVSRAVRRSVLPVAQQALDTVNSAASRVRDINQASGGLLEEGIRSLPVVGESVVRGANVVARGARRGSMALGRIQRATDTIERGSQAIGRRLQGQM